MIEVWHRKNPTFLMDTTKSVEEHKAAWKAGDYEKVATIETKDVHPGWEEEDFAYRITNSIDSYWGANRSVIPVPNKGRNYRSTSVGDVVKRSDGTFLFCAVCGWQRL